MFTTPLGLLGLLALPAILAVHLFRRRFRPRTVSALFLWAAVGADPAAGRRREPLRRSASLLLELLAALLLTLALAGPRWGGAGEPAHIVAIVDGTASMGSVGSDGESALSKAKDALVAAVDSLPGNARVTLIRTGPNPEVIAGPAAFKVEALEAVRGLTSPHQGHDLGAAWDLAVELSRAAGAVFLTDRPSDAPGGTTQGGQAAGVETIGVGQSLANVGFVSATRSPKVRADKEAADELQLVMRSFSGSRETRTLEIVDAATDAVVGGGSVELAPNSSATRRYSVPAATGPVTCRLLREGGDPLAADDKVHLSPPPRRHLRLAAELSDESARALGLGSSAVAAARWASILESASAAPAQAAGTGPSSSSAPHLALVEKAGTDNGITWRLRLGMATDTAASEEPVHLTSPYLIDKAHPLMEGVTLDGVVWTAAGTTGSGGMPLIYSGDLILAAELESDSGAKEWRLDIDPVRSTLGRSPDWPILLTNAAEARRAELPGPVRTSLSVGEAFLWRGAQANSAGPSWTLQSPTGKAESIEPIPGGDLVTRSLTEVGIWKLLEGDEVRANIGVSLMSPGESDLTGGATRGDLGRTITDLASRSTGDGTGAAGPWTLWLGMLALLAIAADWWVLQRPSRRITRTTPGGR